MPQNNNSNTSTVQIPAGNQTQPASGNNTPPTRPPSREIREGVVPQKPKSWAPKP